MILNFYSFKEKVNEPEPLVKTPGTVSGNMFTIENCDNCTLAVCDNCETVHIDNIKRCKVFIGSAVSSIFIRNCEDSVFFTCSQQLRLRDCIRCDFYVFSVAEVHIETSNAVRFGPFRGGYPDHDKHLKTARLDTGHNLWYDIFDHNDPLKTKENWSLIDPATYVEPWFPMGPCESALAANAVGSVDRSKEHDESMASFGLDQLRVDAVKTSSPQKPVAIPLPVPIPAPEAAVQAPSADSEAPAIPAAASVDVSPPEAPAVNSIPPPISASAEDLPPAPPAAADSTA